MCRVRLANVSRAMQEWSAEHGDRLYGCVDLILYGESLVDPASWAKAKWLQRHIAHIIDVGLVMYEVIWRLSAQEADWYQHLNTSIRRSAHVQCNSSVL